MTRAASNLLIVLMMAIVVTAVLAFTSNGSRLDEIADDATSPATTRTTLGVAQSDTGSADTTTAESEATETTGEAETPSYLDPEPTAATEPAPTEVLGATQAQESDPEQLADTGAGPLERWIILAAGIVATGGIVRNAGRDHADGELTLLP